MDHYFVKVVNGEVQGKPEIVSSERTASPNIAWSRGQMAKHGFVRVNLDCGIHEYPDLDHPTVNPDGTVRYEKLLKTQEMKGAEQAVIDEADVEVLIKSKTRDVAIAGLKNDGKLDANGKIIRGVL